MYNVDLTKEELNVLVNGLHFILVRNGNDYNLSEDAEKWYKEVKEKLETVKFG